MTNFNSNLHEELFKLFILASNDWDFSEMNMSKQLTNVVIELRYPFQFNDRAICDEEFEGWIDVTIEPWQGALSAFGVWRKKDHDDDKKIKFRFISEEE